MPKVQLPAVEFLFTFRPHVLCKLPLLGNGFSDQTPVWESSPGNPISTGREEINTSRWERMLKYAYLYWLLSLSALGGNRNYKEILSLSFSLLYTGHRVKTERLARGDKS